VDVNEWFRLYTPYSWLGMMSQDTNIKYEARTKEDTMYEELMEELQ